MTKLFDANAHPRLVAASEPDSFAALVREIGAAEFIGACAVALPGRDGFSDAPYIAECQKKGLFPVAAWPDTPENAIEARFAALAHLGFTAIKIHPRLSGLSVRDRRFAKTLAAAAQACFTVFHCSYQFSIDSRHPADPLPPLLDAVGQSGPKLVLLHGGTVELLRYAEAFRAHQKVLLDLSFTLNRYEGSSLDMDINYLFRTFDQRLCVGSDFPDYRPSQVRSRFEFHARNAPKENRDNIGWRNITSLLGITMRVG